MKLTQPYQQHICIQFCDDESCDAIISSVHLERVYSLNLPVVDNAQIHN